MEGRRAKGISTCLLGQPVGSIYAMGSKWLKQCGKQEVCAPEHAALTIRLCCTTVVLIIPWSVKETWSCLHGPRKQRSAPVNLKLQIPVCDKSQNNGLFKILETAKHSRYYLHGPSEVRQPSLGNEVLYTEPLTWTSLGSCPSLAALHPVCCCFAVIPHMHHLFSASLSFCSIFDSPLCSSSSFSLLRTHFLAFYWILRQEEELGFILVN